MFYFDPRLTVNELRDRLEAYAEFSKTLAERDESTFRRVKSGIQTPSEETIELMMTDIGIPPEGMSYQLLERQPMSMIIKRDQVIQALNLGNTNLAEKLINQMENTVGFKDSALNHQFLLSQKARLLEQQGKPPDEIIPIIKKGITFTLKNFSEAELSNKPLFFEEPELLHTLARLYKKMGDLNAAINLLESVQSGLLRLPSDDRGMELQLSPVLLTLAECYLEARNNTAAISTCDKGGKFSTSRLDGELNPYFVYVKAVALLRTNIDNNAKRLLTASYIGHLVIGNVNEAKKVLSTAKDEFGFDILTFDAENLPSVERIPYNRGNAIECSGLGDMIKKLHKITGVEGKVLAEGICDKSILSRIKSGKIRKPSIFVLEALMQRLGRRIDLYHIFMLHPNQFYDKKKLAKIAALVSLGEFTEAEKLLDEVKVKKAFKNGVNLQFVELYTATLHANKHEYADPDLPQMFLNALYITLPAFDEKYVNRHPLAYTYYEISAINQLACCYGEAEDYTRAFNLFDQLLQNVNRFYIDEFEKARMYAHILFCYTTYLSRAGERRKALYFAEEGIEHEQKYGRLYSMADLTFNKGYNLLKTDRADESILWFVISYYCDILFEGYGLSRPHIVRKLLEDEFGISLY